MSVRVKDAVLEYRITDISFSVNSNAVNRSIIDFFGDHPAAYIPETVVLEAKLDTSFLAEKPMSVMKPLCSAPRRFPAPRMSRSCMAMLKPLPRSEKDSMALRRRRASSVMETSGGTIR